VKHKFNLFLTILFCGFLGGVVALSLLLPYREFSPLENRYLQKPPQLSQKALADGTFMEEAEKFVSDHLAGRDLWVAMKAWCERLSGKKENNGVYFAAQDTLINRVDAVDRDLLYEGMGYLDRLVDNVDVPVYFGIIPSAADVWSERLPAGAPSEDEGAVIDALYSRTKAQTIDLRSALTAHKDEELYYRTDHHWTSLGAYYGYEALTRTLGLEPVPLFQYQRTTVSEEFYGTIFSSSGVRWVPPDRIDTYVPADGIQVTSYFGAKPEEGALYVDSFLEVKDKYSYFLGGNQALCVIDTPNTDAPRVLVVRDSYTDSLAPFLTANFSQIHLYDLRYNRMSLKNYVAENDIDMVVVLYSLSNLAIDRNLFLLGM